MRIAINCRSFMNRQYTGIGRYASGLVRSLVEIDRQNQYLLYAPKRFFNSKRVIPKVSAKNFNVKVDRFKRGVHRTVGIVDIYHSPCPDIFDVQGAKIIVTVHDLVYKAYPAGHTDQTIRLTEEQMQFFLPKVSKVICCSQNTAWDLKKYFNVDDDRICVIYPGVDENVFCPLLPRESSRADQVIRDQGIDGPFVLFVGTLEPRKNLKNLVEAFSLLKKRGKYSGRLVVCGMAGWKSEGFEEHITRLGMREHVVLTGFITDEELRYFYHKADAFAFVSHYEGFGYPIVEAFCCGAAVVTSNVSSCPEVAGDAALKVNPRDPQEIAAALQRIIEDPALKKALKEKGLARAKEFNYLKTARKTLEVYEQVFKL